MAELFVGVIIAGRIFLRLAGGSPAMCLVGHVRPSRFSRQTVLRPAGSMWVRFARFLLFGQFELVLQPEREFVEQVGQRSAIGFLVAQDVHFAIERCRCIAAQLVDFRRN
jgi:hypothetical protein